MIERLTSVGCGHAKSPCSRMGQAGAVDAVGKGGAEDKIEAMRPAGFVVADCPTSLGEAALEAIGK